MVIPIQKILTLKSNKMKQEIFKAVTRAMDDAMDIETKGLSKTKAKDSVEALNSIAEYATDSIIELISKNK